VASFLLVYPLVEGRGLGWPAWVFGLLAAAVPVLGLFVAQQRRRIASGRHGLIEFSLLTKRSYVSGVVFTLIFFGSIVGFSLSVGLFLQLGEGLTPMRASLTMLGWAVGAFLGSGFGATMMAKLGRRILHLGLALMMVGLTGVAWIFSTTTGSVNGWGLALPLVVYGFGMGMIFVPLFDIIMGEVRDHEVGSAASILESLQQLGSSLGVAVLGTVFFSLVGARPLLGDFLHASRQIALIAIGLTVMAFVVGFALPKRARAAYRPEDAQQTAAETPDLVNA
jgi:MFS family permease